MQTFEELLKQEDLEYCVSGHFFDSGMTLQELQEFYRARNLREEKNVNFGAYIDRGAIEGSKFFIDDLVVVNIYSPPKKRMVSQAEEAGVHELKSHVEIYPGAEYYKKKGLTAARNELRLLMQYHIEHKISATCYFPYRKEFQGINRD